MSYRLLDSQVVVQVAGPSLASEALFCTFQSFPSQSILLRTLPNDTFAPDGSNPLLADLSDAVESILSEGVAVGAAGTQGLDASNLIYDAVTFTVKYVPPYPTPGEILGEVQIPVNIITADTSLLGGGGVENAPQQIADEYARLQKLSTG